MLTAMLRPRLSSIAPVILTALMLYPRGQVVDAQDAAVSPTAALVSRVGAYVQRFESEFSNVIAEERYEQTVMRNSRMPIGGAPARREMLSDFLLVRLPEPIGWAPFRDVFEVDNRPLRDRESRLIKLFVNPNLASTRRAVEITADSARYNIGVPRTMNQPVLALQVLRPGEQHRFQFSAPRADAAAGAHVVSIQFRERERPSLFSGPEGSEMPVHGRVWVNEENGTVLKTELLMDTMRLRASIVTRYEDDTAFGLAVPIEMLEDYVQTNGVHVTAKASYGHFRSFGVSVSDRTVGRNP